MSRRVINEKFKDIGFKYVTVDLNGYKTVGEETEEEEAEAMILVDTSSPEEAEAVYEPVMDDELLDTLMPLFEEELEDAEIRN